MSETCPHLHSDGIGAFRCVGCGTIIDANGGEVYMLSREELGEWLQEAIRESWLVDRTVEWCERVAARLIEKWPPADYTSANHLPPYCRSISH